MYAPAAVVHHHHGATTAHGSQTKYFHVGLNRMRALAKNPDWPSAVQARMEMMSDGRAGFGLALRA